MMKKSVCVLAFFAVLFCIGLSGCDGSTSSSKGGDGIFGKPDAPSGVTAIPNSYRSIQVSWRSVGDAVDYKVYRSELSNGPWTRIGSSASTYYADSPVTTGVTYYYRVSATKGSDESEGDKSEVVSARTKLDAPSVVGTSVSAYPGAIYVTWIPVTGASSYKVYRSESSSGPFITSIGTSTSTSYKDTDVTVGNIYYYKVCGVTSTGIDGDLSSTTASQPVLPPTP